MAAMTTAARQELAMNYDGGLETVEHALELLGQALSILDGENLLVAAAKVDEVRTTLREFAALD